MGVDAALSEGLVYAEDGLLAADGFKTYLLPRADDLPPIEVEHQVTPSLFSFLGAKGAGEAGFAGAMVAVFNAVHDAIRSAGRAARPPAGQRAQRAGSASRCGGADGVGR